MELRRAMFKIHSISCSILNVDVYKSLAKSKKTEYVQARQYTIAVTKEIFPKETHIDIGGVLYGKDHSTVTYSLKIISNYRNAYKSTEEIYKKILKRSKKKLGMISRKDVILTNNEIKANIQKLAYKTGDVHSAIETNRQLSYL